MDNQQEEGIRVTPNDSEEVNDSMSSSIFFDEPLYNDDKKYSGLLDEE